MTPRRVGKGCPASQIDFSNICCPPASGWEGLSSLPNRLHGIGTGASHSWEGLSSLPNRLHLNPAHRDLLVGKGCPPSQMDFNDRVVKWIESWEGLSSLPNRLRVDLSAGGSGLGRVVLPPKWTFPLSPRRAHRVGKGCPPSQTDFRSAGACLTRLPAVPQVVSDPAMTRDTSERGTTVPEAMSWPVRARSGSATPLRSMMRTVLTA